MKRTAIEDRRGCQTWASRATPSAELAAASPLLPTQLGLGAPPWQRSRGWMVGALTRSPGGPGGPSALPSSPCSPCGGTTSIKTNSLLLGNSRHSTLKPKGTSSEIKNSVYLGLQTERLRPRGKGRHGVQGRPRHGSRNLEHRTLFFTLGWTSLGASPVVQTVKNPPAMQETQVRPLAWENPCKREWLPTPVFLPGEFHGQRSLAGYGPRSCKESDTTK